MPTITFEDSDRYSDNPYHNRPLFIIGIIDEQPGLVVNILLVKILTYLGINSSQLKPRSLVIQGFNQSEQHPLDSIRLKTKFRQIEDWTSFFVIEANDGNVCPDKVIHIK